MKLVIEKHAAEAALRRVVSVIEKRNTLSILSNVMIETDNGKIKIRVTNLDMEATDTAPCEISEPGATTVDAGKLYEIVRGFPAGSQIKIETDPTDPRLVIAAGRSRFRLPVLPVADFPVLEMPAWPTTISIEAASLGAIIAKSSYAAAVNDARYIMNATYLQAVDGKLRAAAGGGPRVAYSETPADLPADFRALLPPRAVAEFQKRLADTTGFVTLCASPSRIALIDGDSVISSKLIDGEYVDYVRAIPRDVPSILTVDADCLADAVRGVMLVVDDKVPGVRLTIEGDSLIVTSKSNHADARAEVEISYEGEPIAFMLSGSNVLDVIGALNADALEILIKDEKTPTVWRKAGDESSICVMAPMRAGA